MKKIFVLSLICCLFICGCSTSSAMNKISIGMPKEQVIKTLGNPISVSADGTCEYLNYKLLDNIMDDTLTPYYVRLVNGKVDAYGRNGDFMVPQQQISVDLHQDTTGKK